jgi:outer membrane murein-binding lipoprotein Lpp
MMRFLLAAAVLTAGCALAQDAELSTRERAELKMLRATTEKQSREIDTLRAKLAELEKKAKAAESAPKSPATRSAIPGADAPVGVPARAADTSRAAPPTGKGEIFIVDATASMGSQFEKVREELEKMLAAQKSGDLCNVLMFQETSVYGAASKMVPVSPSTLDQFRRFMTGVAPHGSTDPIQALTVAFQMDPETMWLLSDGDFPDNYAILRFLADRRKQRAIPKINTMLKFSGGEESDKVLQLIAAETEGICLNRNGANIGLPAPGSWKSKPAVAQRPAATVPAPVGVDLTPKATNTPGKKRGSMFDAPYIPKP